MNTRRQQLQTGDDFLPCFSSYYYNAGGMLAANERILIADEGFKEWYG
jgi:hypothetical protein